MRRLLTLLAFAAAATAPAQQSFTLQQILSAPYSTSLTAAPVGNLFAWVEDAEGVHNIWIGGPNSPARQLTHYTQDDAQDIASLTWSPDATSIAYVYGAETGSSGRPANPAHLQRPTPIEIYLQPIDGGASTLLGEGHAPLFSRDGASIFFLRNGQIFTADLSCLPSRNCHPEHREGPASPAAAQLPAEPVLFDRGTASQLALSPDGTKLAYISHRRTHNFLALFNLTTKELTFPAPSTGNDSAPSFSRDGKYLAWLRFPFTNAPEFAGNRTSPNPWSIQLDDLSTSTTRTLFTPEANKPGSAEPRMSTGEDHLYFDLQGRVIFFSEADGWVHLYAIDISGQRPPQLLTPGKFEVEDAVFDPQTEAIFYASNQALTDPLDVDRRQIWEVDRPGESTGPVAFSHVGIETHPQPSSAGIAALVSDGTYPMHPAMLVGGGWKSLHSQATPSTYPATSLVTPTQIIFPSSDKLFQLHGHLFLPPGKQTVIQINPYVGPTTETVVAGKHPAILFFHGGPKRQMLLGYPAMDYYSNAYAMNQYLASRGYIVLSVNYRGGIGYGLDFRQCQHCGADGAAEYADVLGAVAYLRSRTDVDSAHIGIWGGSYGGYLTALALARNSDLFAAGVDFHGVHEWAREDNAAADWLRGPLADQEKIAALAHISSPMADVAKWKSPVLLIHGDDDPEVAYAQTPMLADALRARNVHVEELIFPDELHGFLLHKDWLAAYEAAANFFDRTLKPATGQPVATNLQ
jgi:dipeptidyl aminopeptidase/acylaminoacyl peptidase